MTIGPASAHPVARLSRSLSSSPVQTFVAIPCAVMAVDYFRGSPRYRLSGFPLLLAGYGLYRLAGHHRRVRRAGPRGSASPPRVLVTDGPYRATRNPMYLGHLIFLAGLVLSTRSPLAVLLALRQTRRFALRVRDDEERLERIFGDEYRAYRARVPRWTPLLAPRRWISPPSADLPVREVAPGP